MILTKTVKIKISNNQYKYYSNLGYEPNIIDIFEILVEHLPKGSNHLIQVQCDYCLKIKEISHKRYILNTNDHKRKYACSKVCCEDKIKETNLERYGVENTFQSEEKKIKIKETNLKKHGVEYPSQSSKVRDKVKKTNLKNFGFEHVIQSSEIKEKIKQTNLERYGVENYNQNNEVREEQSKIESEIFLNEIKIKYPNLIAVSSSSGKTFFNCDNGYEHIFPINAALLQSRYNNINTKVCTICYPPEYKYRSQSEVRIFELISFYYKDIIPNYNLTIGKNKKLQLDIFIPSLKLGIEFNGMFWHSERYKKNNNYHLEKYEVFNKNGIELIYIWEDDWNHLNEIVMSNIYKRLKIDVIKNINDSSLSIPNIDEVNEFLKNNHLDGKTENCNYISLTNNNEIVSICAFKTINNDIHIIRYVDIVNFNVDNSFKIFIEYLKNNYKFNNIFYKIDFSLYDTQFLTDNNFIKVERTLPEMFIAYNKKHRNDENNSTMTEKNELRIWNSGFDIYQL